MVFHCMATPCPLFASLDAKRQPVMVPASMKRLAEDSGHSDNRGPRGPRSG
jgi:hypothetical protein